MANFIWACAMAYLLVTCVAGGPKEEDLISNNTLMVLKSSANEVLEEIHKEPECDEWCQQEKTFK